MTLRKFQKRYPIDRKRWQTIAAFQNGNSWVIVHLAETDDTPLLCLQHDDKCAYFDTMDAMNDYSRERWNKSFRWEALNYG